MGSMTIRGGPDDVEQRTRELEVRGATDVTCVSGDGLLTFRFRWDAGKLLENTQIQPLQKPAEEVID